MNKREGIIHCVPDPLYQELVVRRGFGDEDDCYSIVSHRSFSIEDQNTAQMFGGGMQQWAMDEIINNWWLE